MTVVRVGAASIVDHDLPVIFSGEILKIIVLRVEILKWKRKFKISSIEFSF